MARVNIPLQTPAVNGGAQNTVAWTAANASLGMYFDNSSGHVALLVRNDAVGANSTITIKSVADPYGRSKDTTITCPAAAAGIPGISALNVLAPVRFNQSDGSVNVNIGTDTTLYFAAIALQKLP
jgi:hypothetical protein